MPLTIEFVIRATPTVGWQAHTVFEAVDGTAQILFVAVRPTDGKIEVDIGPQAAATQALVSSIGVGDGEPHHVVIQLSTAAQHVYIDGVERTATSNAVTDPGAPVLMSIGGTLRGGPFGGPMGLIGNLADVAVYSGWLSAGRIAAHFAAFQAWANMLTGTRISKILDAAGWSSADRSIDVGQSLMQPTGLETAALDAIRTAVLTDGGAAAFYISGGAARFRDRRTPMTAAVMTTSQATFADDGTNLSYSDVEPAYAIDLIANKVRSGRRNGAVQEVTDATSQTRFFRRTLDRTGTELTTDAEALNAAQDMLIRRKDQKRRYRSLMVEPYGSESTLLKQIFERKIGDRVTVTQTPPGGTAITQDLIIEGRKAWILDDMSVGCIWWLSPADTTSYLVLDDATKGKLDSGNALAY